MLSTHYRPLQWMHIDEGLPTNFDYLLELEVVSPYQNYFANNIKKVVCHYLLRL